MHKVETYDGHEKPSSVVIDVRRCLTFQLFLLGWGAGAPLSGEWAGLLAGICWMTAKHFSQLVLLLDAARIMPNECVLRQSRQCNLPYWSFLAT